LGDRTRLRYFWCKEPPRNDGGGGIPDGGDGALRALAAGRSGVSAAPSRSRNEFFLLTATPHFGLELAPPISRAEPFNAQDKQAPPLQVMRPSWTTPRIGLPR